VLVGGEVTVAYVTAHELPYESYPAKDAVIFYCPCISGVQLYP
jgi:hypothetical protein